jgi:ATP-binding cassette subfamily B (MDR/TAP) protein 1
MNAFVSAILVFLQTYVFGLAGENLTLTIRRKLFDSIIYKNVSWFDSKQRAPGILTGILSEDVTEINGLSTETIAVYLEGIIGILIALIIAFKFTWRMALISIVTAPLVILGGFMMSRTAYKGNGMSGN